MPLFKCAKCGDAENTALSNHWRAKAESRPVLCSECDPAIGAWHGTFPKRTATGYKLGDDGFLYHPDEIARGVWKHLLDSGALKIIGDA